MDVQVNVDVDGSLNAGTADRIGHKEQQLAGLLAGQDRLAIAFSGGADSSYLLALAVDVLGAARALALTADSPLMPRRELAEARTLAGRLGAVLRVLPVDPLADDAVASNPPDRCYHCKRGRFLALRAIATERGFPHLLHGENLDDAADYRPGTRAARELDVRAPLAKAGMTKADIRSRSRERQLSTWDLPARACLGSRFPYGTPLTAAGLARVEAAENYLEREFGLIQFRVRDHHPVARLEVESEQIARLAAPGVRERIAAELKLIGYHYVALDLSGYRMGSLNDGINA